MIKNGRKSIAITYQQCTQSVSDLRKVREKHLKSSLIGTAVLSNTRHPLWFINIHFKLVIADNYLGFAVFVETVWASLSNSNFRWRRKRDGQPSSIVAIRDHRNLTFYLLRIRFLFLSLCHYFNCAVGFLIAAENLENQSRLWETVKS